MKGKRNRYRTEECKFCYEDYLNKMNTYRNCYYCDFPYVRTEDKSYYYCSLRCRLLSRVKKDPDSECWIWNSNVDRDSGYGYFQFNKVKYTAHRASYELFVGKILPDFIICHTCDNKTCVNPVHLWQGTPRENSVDYVVKQKRRKEDKIKREMQMSLLG